MQYSRAGILYESCVDYCQQKATASKSSNSIEFTNILSESEFSDSDLSLLSWLQSLSPDTFSCPFEQRSLNVDVERIQKPILGRWQIYICLKIKLFKATILIKLFSRNLVD